METLKEIKDEKDNRYCYCSDPTKRTSSGKPYSTLKHRAVWIEHNGEIPIGYLIHHINHNKKDNRIENLQMVTRSEHTLLHSKGSHNQK